jgi:hypothetical protein
MKYIKLYDSIEFDDYDSYDSNYLIDEKYYKIYINYCDSVEERQRLYRFLRDVIKDDIYYEKIKDDYDFYIDRFSENGCILLFLTKIGNKYLHGWDFIDGVDDASESWYTEIDLKMFYE